MTNPLLDVKNVSHKFGEIIALNNVSISANKGEFLTLLGESGSGKTTLLRIIAGLETPSAVEYIKLSGENITNYPPNKRNCTTVFQSYALFPHMTVFKNIDYGLKIRKYDETERKARVENGKVVSIFLQFEDGTYELMDMKITNKSGDPAGIVNGISEEIINEEGDHFFVIFVEKLKPKKKEYKTVGGPGDI